MSQVELNETERQLLALAAQEPLTRDEDPDGIDALLAKGFLREDDATFLTLTVYVLTPAGRAALEGLRVLGRANE